MCAIFGVIGDTSKNILKKCPHAKCIEVRLTKFYINHEKIFFRNESIGSHR